MQFNRIGNFWDRSGHNEIDVVAVNDTKKIAIFIEAKRRQKNYNEQDLLEKVTYAKAKLKLKGYTIKHRGVSLDTLEAFIADFPAA